jgi:acyl-homoserine-lactone acylase
MNHTDNEGLTRRGFLGGAAAAVVVAGLPSGRASATLARTPPDLARWHQQAAHVRITRDNWGIAHVGKTDAHAVFGMIYAQAEDDFNRIDELSDQPWASRRGPG